LILGEEIPLKLRGYTRGRGENLLKGKTGTLGSREELDYWTSNLKERLNFQKLKTTYRKYFGLLQAKLYGSLSVHSARTLSPSGLTILRKVKREMKRTPSAALETKLNLYNAGIKINELFLQANTLRHIPEE
jgi:hypothetical protein